MNISKVNFSGINPSQNNKKTNGSSQVSTPVEPKIQLAKPSLENLQSLANISFGSQTMLEKLPLTARAGGMTITHALAENNDRINSFYKGTLKDLIELKNPEEVAESIKIQDDFKETPVHIAARVADRSKGLELLAENFPEAVKETLTMQNKQGRTPVHILIMNSRNTDAIDMLTEKFPDTIEKTLTIQDELGNTPVSAAIYFLPESGLFEYFCEQYPEATKKALTLQRKDGKTPVYTARFIAENQNQTAPLNTIKNKFPELLK